MLSVASRMAQSHFSILTSSMGKEPFAYDDQIGATSFKALVSSIRVV